MSQLNRSFKITFVYFPSRFGLPHEGIEERGGENGGKRGGGEGVRREQEFTDPFRDSLLQGRGMLHSSFLCSLSVET